MNPAIFSLGTALPPYVYKQKEIAGKLIEIFSANEKNAALIQKVCLHSAIEKRHSIIGDFHKSREEWNFWGSSYPQTNLGMTQRNLRYKQEAPFLAEKAAKQALDRWGGECSRISHILSVSCTGVIAPGIEYHLMQNLGLPSTANRLGINFMGCFGAFKGISVSSAFARENPKSRILLVCTELCSLHLQSDQDEETITANSLFSDGAAAAVIGSNPSLEETPLWEIIRTHSMGFKHTLDKMSWEASDSGFRMRLSRTVPVLIKREMKAFSKNLLMNDVKSQECDWAIHPGGKSILQAVEKALTLQPEQTKAAWNVLANYGNMSSATFLFVLEELSRQKRQHAWTAGLGFGPGLSAEGVLLKHAN